MAELLTVMAPRKTILSCARLHHDRDVAAVCSRKISWVFAVLGKVIRRRGRFMVVGQSDGCYLLDNNNVKPGAHQPVRYVFCGGVVWQVTYHRLHRFFFWVLE
jgi:hypothetical protein